MTANPLQIDFYSDSTMQIMSTGYSSISSTDCIMKDNNKYLLLTWSDVQEMHLEVYFLSTFGYQLNALKLLCVCVFVWHSTSRLDRCTYFSE